LLLGADETAPLSIRLVRGAAHPKWIERTEPGRVSPLARLLRGEGEPRRLEGHAQGAFVIQEEGAQVVALALGVRPGERVLDACAGRGQKSSLFAEQLAGSGELWATDAYPAKAPDLGRGIRALEAAGCAHGGGGLDRGARRRARDFDRVLVDAPCTGVGTLRRRPEIALRLQPEDPVRLAELGRRILRGAAARVRPGGRVVYAVCSVLTEECENVIESVRDVLTPAPFDAPELPWLEPATTQFRLLPGRHGTDGYFVASLVRAS
jgi:16S rRNA (cytosine967-C5)-methyltransferase